MSDIGTEIKIYFEVALKILSLKISDELVELQNHLEKITKQVFSLKQRIEAVEGLKQLELLEVKIADSSAAAQTALKPEAAMHEQASLPAVRRPVEAKRKRKDDNELISALKTIEEE